MDQFLQPDSPTLSLAKWVIREDLSKGSVDRLPRNVIQIIRGDSESQGNKPEGIGQTSLDFETIVCEEIEGLQGFTPKWVCETFTLDEHNETFEVWYHDPIELIRFLIGYKPFAPDLVYAPVRDYNSDDERCFSQAHTANAWWNLQTQLPEGATVVPIQWMTDKTHLTNSRGDQTAYPCYMSIFNISREVRRMTSRPASLPVALIPTIPKHLNKVPGIRRKVYHLSMAIIFQGT